tara:strand:+ start:458 stop:742 length:285 start_codon:yes stop_codon:yes gene_type:complete
MPDTAQKCEFCGAKTPLTFHHLIPKACHSNKWFKKHFDKEALHHGITLCRPCHNKVHSLFDEKRLGREFNSKDKLLAVESLQRFLSWRKKRLPD